MIAPDDLPSSIDRQPSSNVLVGTSAWSDHDEFYPPKLPAAERLAYYATQFPVVEVNTTYYRVPSRSMVENWVARTPPGFVFDVKPPRELTSTPEQPGGEPPEPDADIAAAFADAISPLAEAGVESPLVVPLRERPRLPYGPDDIGFIQELADRAALAIDNARL